MSKRLISAILVLSLILGMSSITFGTSQPKPNAMLNGTTISLENGIYVNESGQIMCPLRELAEKMDYNVTWNDNDKSIGITNNTKDIKLTIGQSTVAVNGEKFNLKSNPIIKGDKTFVPLELFSNGFNLIVGWDSKNQVLKINQPKENKEDFFAIHEDKKIQDELDTYMKALEKNRNFHGSVLVTKDGKILLDKGYGFSNLEQNTMNKPQTKFAIGSMTKQFTAMAIMQLNEKGLINVDDKISKYFPELPNGEKITIHNLLTHTSGLMNYTDLSEFWALKPDNKDPLTVINLIKDMPLEFEPGKQFKYCNTNYVLLGMIVENVTGMTLEDYLQKNIFAPLNMTNTGICYGKNNQYHDATPYSGYLEVVPVDDDLTLTQAYGAGSMYSTVEDLYRWDQALKTEKLVKKATLDKIFKEHIAFSETDGYGYGWMISNTENGKEIYHNGNTLGFTSNIARYMDKGISIIILTNNGYCNVMDLTNSLANIVLNKDYEVPKAIEEIKIDDPDLLNKYEGKYEFINGTYLNIIKKDNRLYAQVTGQEAFEIYSQSNNKFFAKLVDASFEFKTNDKGEVTEIIFNQLGAEIVCKRVDDAKEKVEITVDPKIYDDYVGEYELVPGLTITITQKDNRLYAQVTGQDAFEIFPKSESEYFYKIVDAEITFERDDNGKVTKLVLHQNGQDMPAAKIK